MNIIEHQHTLPVGTVIMTQSVVPPDAKWMLMDGAAFDPLVYVELSAVLRGATVLPDITNLFPRSRQQSGIDGYDREEDLTARPVNPFITNTTGQHTHTIGETLFKYDRRGDVGLDPQGNEYSTTFAGDHTHALAGGGDAETVPNHMNFAFMIKVL